VDSAHAYRFSRCALSISLTSKLKRYSSDRLFRALACGPVVLVKRFAEYSALGLRDGVNCFLFDTPEEASALASRILKETSDGGAYELWRSIGKAGAELAFEHHTWTCRMREQAVYLNYLRRSSHRD
jgi:glycosyltransferase involved in cell wall biosynthesis